MISKIQTELKVPKGQYNNFGKYKYRSLEDILESIKPILKKYECGIILSDTIEYIGNRYYIKATAKLVDNDEHIIAENTAYARESEVKKGMDSSQITGATSSYARKYALNGLLAIDDTKDTDTEEYQKNDHILTKKDIYAKFKAILKNRNIEEVDFMEYLKAKGVNLGDIIGRFIKEKKVQDTVLKECEDFLTNQEATKW